VSRSCIWYFSITSLFSAELKDNVKPPHLSFEYYLPIIVIISLSAGMSLKTKSTILPDFTRTLLHLGHSRYFMDPTHLISSIIILSCPLEQLGIPHPNKSPISAVLAFANIGDTHESPEVPSLLILFFGIFNL